MTENELGEIILGAAIEVHKELGPGLLESTYEACLDMELTGKGITVKRQVVVPVKYKGLEVSGGYRLDHLIEDIVVVEVKSIDTVSTVHRAQVVSYLKLGGFRLGYLINFNERLLRNGISRFANGL